MLQKQGTEHFEDVVCAHPGAHGDCERLTGELIQNGQHLVAPPVAELVVHEVPSRQIALHFACSTAAGASQMRMRGQWIAQTWFGSVGLSRVIQLSLW